MADFFFFTETDTVENQLIEGAYGPVLNNELSYRVNNLFLVEADAPAIAIVDSIPLVQQCETNPDCVNIVLFPIKNADFNFPTIKLFIYRGIKKSSLFENSGEIKMEDSSWKTNNILKVIHDLQDKINVDANTPGVTPKAENLGYHYSDVSDTENFKEPEEYIEKIIFLEDDLQLPLLKAGCQIGQFIGGTTPAGFQIVLDRVGYEPQLSLARKEDDIITVAELPDPVTEITKFQHCHEKEAILTYIDVAAFYGCAKANKQNVRVYKNSADKEGEKVDALEVVNLFYNKNICYIDIRNDYNYSYNYYKNFRDNLELGFQQSNTEDLLIEDIDYYDTWPLLRLINKEVPVDKPISNVSMKLPINDVAQYNSRYFLRSYTHEFIEKEESSLLQELNTFDNAGTIRKDFCEQINIKPWINEGGLLGANYFYFKYGKIQISEISDDILSRRNQYDIVFPLEMKNLLGDDDLEDLDFKVSIYSSENAPIVYKNFLDISNEYYTQTIGIARDKFNTTFFSFADLIGYSDGVRLKYPFSIVRKGKYDNSAYLNEIEYNSTNEDLGFLAALPFRLSGSNLQLTKIKREFESEIKDFLYYLNTAPAEDNIFSIDTNRFHVVTITNDEYDTAIALKEANFDNVYRAYLDVGNETINSQNYDGFSIGCSTLKIKGLLLDTIEDKIETNDIVVEKTITQGDGSTTVEETEFNFYINKT